MLWQALGAARDLGRIHDIASVLIRYGFGDLVRRIGMAGALERAGKVLHWRAPEEIATMEPPTRVRRALEDLGPTFIKLGQILSTRVDLFPPEWIEELSKLQDAAPAASFEDILAQLTEDLGESPEAIFAELERTPLAAASLAQVHRAWMADGTVVILKVRRPGIRPIIEADLRLLARLAEIAETEAPELHRYRPREVVRQFTLSLRRELDFAAECRNAERISSSFASHAEIVVPRVHWQWCGERLNVQDYIDGIPGRDIAAAEAAGLNRKLLARHGANAVLKMMLEDGFFHADPHQGNVFYLPGNRLAFIDFGMVGRLSEERRYQVALLLHGMVARDPAPVTDVLLDWSGDTDADTSQLGTEIDAFLDHYHGAPLKDIDLGAMLSDLITILRDHALSLPSDLALLVKAFITLEGMGRQLDPDFDVSSEARPFLERILLEHYSPTSIAKRGWRSLTGMAELLSGLPKDLGQLLRASRRGKIRLQIDVMSLKHFGDRLDRAASRLTMGIVTAALIIGSSIAFSASDASAGWPPIALLGFIGAFIGGIWILFSIWRSGKE